MKKQFAALILLVVLAGCGQASEQTLPTLMPTPVQEVATEAVVPVEASATSVPVDRPTLPPTWTPAGSTVETPIPDASNVDTSAQTEPQGLPTLVVCGSFAVDRERTVTSFDQTTPPTVYWTAVPTAARYRIALVNDKGEEIFVDYAIENSYTFRSDLFERNQRYAWEAYPEDALNQQMCIIKIGLELFPQ